MSNATSKSDVVIPAQKGFGHPISVIFWTLAIFIVSQVLALLIVEAFTPLLSSQPLSISGIENSAAGQFFYIFIAELLVILSVYLLLRRRRMSLKTIGFGRRPRWSDVSWSTLSFVLFVTILIIVTAIITGLWHGYDTNQLQDVGFKTTTTGAGKLIAFISLVFLPPLGEETLMRGYLFTGLRLRWSFVIAGLVTSLLFGAAHLLTGQNGLLWAAAVDTFILSLFLVYLREKTGALYAGMGLHALNNVLAFFVYFHS